MNKQKKIFSTAKRIVIKVGSNVLTAEHGLNTDAIGIISQQISLLFERGIEIVMVSSGAMAAGCKKIGLAKRPADIPSRQAVAAVGQAGLILEYEKAFSKYNKKVAQILLTQSDLNHRERYLNARNTLNTLLSWSILPIINENDTVVTEEIKFGDNDNLSAMIALLMDANILINLTDIDGLYTKDPRTNPDAELIKTISNIDHKIKKMAGGIPGALGTGGMLSKIHAAEKVTAAGIPMVIANGKKPNTLNDLFSGKQSGTYFVANENKLSKRKCWIAFSRKPKGKIQVDDGAAQALLHNGKSLLPIGIIAVEGSFMIGDCVELFSADGRKLAIGLVNYSAVDILKIMGHRSNQIEFVLGSKPYDEVIHRDNLAIRHEKEY
ncbi:MAG: glutamate 5-kinase [Pseudomonadota bacterium]